MISSGPQYIAPESIEDALRIKSEKGSNARVIAGGTDLILRMRDRVLTPDLLVDLRRIPLAKIACTEAGMRIGPSVSLSQILAHDELAKLYPALTEACRPFAGPPIRNRATIGGNIVNASPAADLAPPLMAYDARLVLSSQSGDRELALDEFFTGPGQTVLAPDEILTEIRLPKMPANTAAHFIKLGQRRSMAISIVNLSTRLSLDADAVVTEARIVLGAVAPTPMRAVQAEKVLIGTKMTAELIDRAAQMASEDISPISDVRGSGAYRRRMARVLSRRALTATVSGLAEADSIE
jgi:carbon-monoxide dehydrogenase medium subunit